MFRLTRPLFQAVTKTTTGIHGIPVHSNPLPELKETYERTLEALRSKIPESSIYRQGAEALTLQKLKVLEVANGNIDAAEKELDEGQIEQSLMIAQDELNLVDKMAEWKAWEPLEEKPQPGQWEYFGNTSNAVSGSS